MQMIVYAVRTSDAWRCYLSLDMQVDLHWWYGDGEGQKGISGRSPRMVILASSIPLGWAASIRDTFRLLQEMDQWGVEEWQGYVDKQIGSFISEEPERSQARWRNVTQDVRMLDERAVLSGWTPSGSKEWTVLMRQAEQLISAIEGRALLAGEVEALLAEAAGGTGGWRSAAQLGVLLGRLRMEAGLAQPAPRVPPGRLRRGRAMAPAAGDAAARPEAARHAPRAARRLAPIARPASRWGAAALAPCCCMAQQGRPCGARPGAPTAALGRWGLSAAQSAAAGAALRFLAEPPAGGSAGPARFLIWAVTGAGKTEMIFPLLQAVLDAGGRVLVAAPRRDVVLELAPRLSKAFPDEQVITLYGGSPERWKRGSITLATTHQLLRFREAFDLVVIDEIDAFPYHNDPMLAYAARNACKKEGKYIYLSATPPAPLQREAARGRLPHAKVPARFHGHPLPVPRKLKIFPVHRCLQQRRLPVPLVRSLRASLSRGAQVFLFVSRIRHIAPFLELLQQSMPDMPMEGTSSVDPARADKVMAFRNREIRLLVTTTILERGVTVPKSDVYIMDANSDLFDEAALIQMAGRAGRSKDDPAGRVVFAAPQWTRSQSLAVRQIKQMNRIAGKGATCG